MQVVPKSSFNWETSLTWMVIINTHYDSHYYLLLSIPLVERKVSIILVWQKVESPMFLMLGFSSSTLAYTSLRLPSSSHFWTWSFMPISFSLFYQDTPCWQCHSFKKIWCFALHPFQWLIEFVVQEWKQFHSNTIPFQLICSYLQFLFS